MEGLFCHAEYALLGAVGAEVESAEDVRLGAFEFILDESVAQEFFDFGDGDRECCLELMRFCGQYFLFYFFKFYFIF